MNTDFDNSFLLESGGGLAGVDEVGRGCLAGPVTSACVYLDYDKRQDALEILKYLEKSLIADSKTLSSKQRQKVLGIFNFRPGDLREDEKFELYKNKNCNLSVSIASISNTLVDQINILNASLLSMKNAFEKLHVKGQSGYLLVDGNKCPPLPQSKMMMKPIVKGDQKSLLIALASIVAKEFRDHFMFDMDKIYPSYNFKKNVGYGTKEHLFYLRQFGYCDIHRQTFRGVRE